MEASPTLRRRDPDPAALLREYATASSGARTMIAAAISLLPGGLLPDGVKIPPFRLNDVSSLDGENTRALLEAIAIQAGHIEVLPGDW